MLVAAPLDLDGQQPIRTFGSVGRVQFAGMPTFGFLFTLKTQGFLMARIPKIDSRYCCFWLRIGRSKIHGWGLYAVQDIPPNRKVIEYTGERISMTEARRRRDSPYLFVLDDRCMIDGAVRGSGAELINHSCAPNLVTRIVKGHILFMSLRPIRKDEELTVDYNYDDTDETLRCICGAPNCRGTINIKQPVAGGLIGQSS
jgi:hypothetical protein